MSARDRARFGLLFLNRGKWTDDRKIVTEEWAARSVFPYSSHESDGYHETGRPTVRKLSVRERATDCSGGRVPADSCMVKISALFRHTPFLPGETSDRSLESSPRNKSLSFSSTTSEWMGRRLLPVMCETNCSRRSSRRSVEGSSTGVGKATTSGCYKPVRDRTGNVRLFPDTDQFRHFRRSSDSSTGSNRCGPHLSSGRSR